MMHCSMPCKTCNRRCEPVTGRHTAGWHPRSCDLAWDRSCSVVTGLGEINADVFCSRSLTVLGALCCWNLKNSPDISDRNPPPFPLCRPRFLQLLQQSVKVTFLNFCWGNSLTNLLGSQPFTRYNFSWGLYPLQWTLFWTVCKIFHNVNTKESATYNEYLTGTSTLSNE